MKKLHTCFFSFFLLFIVSHSAFGQVDRSPLFWTKNYGGSSVDNAASIKSTPDGGRIMCGTTTSNNFDVSGLHGTARDIWVVKLDKKGSIEWQKTFLSTSNDDANSIILTSDGGYAISGSTVISGIGKALIIKISGNGTLQWQKDIGGTTSGASGWQLAETMDGGFVITGETQGTPNGEFVGLTNHGGSDLFVAKVSSTGAFLWARIWGGDQHERGFVIRQLTDGNLLVAGRAVSNNGDVTGNHNYYDSGDFWVLKLSPTGDIIWKKCYGGSGDETPYNGFEKNNRYYLIGTTMNLSRASSGDVNGVIDGYDMWFVVLDTAGNLIRQKCIGGTASVDHAHDIAPTLDNNFIIGGSTYSNDVYVSGNHGEKDFALIKVDSLGNKLWGKLFGSSGSESGYSLSVNADSSYSLLGDIYGVGGDVTSLYGLTDMWIVNYTDTSLYEDLYVKLKDNSPVYVGNSIQYKINFGKNNNTNLVSSDTVTLNFIKDSRLQLLSSSKPVSSITGDTLIWKIHKNAILKNDSTVLKFGIESGQAFSPDSIRVKAIILPYSNELFQKNNLDSLMSKIRYQNESITNIAFDITSVPTVLINQDVNYTIPYSFKSLLDTTGGIIQLIKDPKVDFKSAVPTYTAIKGDTIIWNFSTTAPDLTGSIALTLHIKDTPQVQIGSVIKNRIFLQFNTIDTAVLKRNDSLSQLVQFDCVPANMVNTTLTAPQGIQWLRVLGGSAQDYATASVALPDTSFILAGMSYSHDGDFAGSSPDANGYVIKYHSNGNMVWKKEIGGAKDDQLSSVVKAENGSLILVGETRSTDGSFAGNHGNADILITKVDANGNILWLKTIGGSRYDGHNPVIRKLRDNQYVIFAYTNSNDGDAINPNPNFTYGNPWLFVINEEGAILWQKTLPDTLFDDAYDMQVTQDGNFVIAGYSFLRDLSLVVGRIVKVDSSGTILFSKDYLNYNHSIMIYSILPNPDGTLTFAGEIAGAGFTPTCVGSHGSYDALVGKTDQNGNLLWQKAYGGSNFEHAKHILPTKGGGYLLSGRSNSDNGNVSGLHKTNPGNFDGWIIKLDENGELEWQKIVGGNLNDAFYHAIQLANNDFVVTGLTSSYNTGDIFNSKGVEDAFFVKIGASNNIRGSVFLDINGNHIKDNNEQFFTNGTVTSVKGSLVNSSNIKNGFYANSVDTGIYITTPVVSLPYYVPYPPADTSRFDNYLQSDTVNFAMVPVAAINDLRITMVPVTAARPGFTAQYKVNYENTGTTIVPNGSVKIVKDSRTVFESSSVTTSVEEDTITFNVFNIAPMQSAEFTVNLKLATPPRLNNGDTLKHYATINYDAADTTPLNNRADIIQVVTGSFDPNDKTESHGPGLEEHRLFNGEYLNYVIRFQNTGTDTAFRVIIRDTLSNKMDWSSLEMISASHTYTLSITDQNKLEWKFDPIILPDSTHNLLASNGYVAFRIKPKSNLALGDTIANRAGIYFDFNLPVITNVQETVISPSILSRPVINGLLTEYCRNSGIVIGKIANPQPLNTGIATAVKLDNTTLTVAADGSFSFDVSSLTEGNHTLSVKFTLASTTMLTEWQFNVKDPGILNLNLSANTINVTGNSQPVIITGVNATGGSNLQYSYARDRSFTNILQIQSNINAVTIDPSTLNPGINWIYGRIHANGQCYSEDTNIDSIQINVTIVTGIVDVDAPGKSINIYPVPFNDYLMLKGFSVGKKYEVSMVNANGITIYTTTIQNRDSYKFKTSGLPAGVYFIHLFKNGQKLGAVKVVKQY